jgi:hypothetical protein
MKNLTSIDFHAVVLDLFRPFITGQPEQRLKTFNPQDSSPHAVYSASVTQLKRLLLVYRKSFPAATYSVLWHTAALYVANVMIHEAKVKPTTVMGQDWKFYLRLCLTSYIDLYAPYPIVGIVARGLLCMAMRDGVMTVSDVLGFTRQLETNSRNHDIPVEDMKASFIVDLNLAVTNPAAARAEMLAEKFTELALLSRFTNNMIDAAGDAQIPKPGLDNMSEDESMSGM